MRYSDIIEARVNKKIKKATLAGTRYLTGARRDDQTPETLRGRFIKAGEDLTAGQKRAEESALKARLKKGKKKAATNEARTIPKNKQGGFQPKTTSSDTSAAPTEVSLEGRTAKGKKRSRAEYRKRMMQAESYLGVGDALADVLGLLSEEEQEIDKPGARRNLSSGEVKRMGSPPERLLPDGSVNPAWLEWNAKARGAMSAKRNRRRASDRRVSNVPVPPGLDRRVGPRRG